ncbi:hypothetical protein [Amycolatopsis sp. NPDC051128]|uniref:hypothetical protein n=1 Tax=Amycolatopsis sp. NPDC051128 TaxID=3155412 RepID=UPI0034458496
MPAAVAVGAAAAAILHLTGLERSRTYSLLVTALLGLGLYASTRSIALTEFRNRVTMIALAVTVGVVAKIAIIFGVMYLCFRKPDHLVLAVAMAQIDPLAVAAVRARQRLSPRTNSLLSAWASFDDPVTALLTVYVTAFLSGSGDGRSSFGAGFTAFAQNLFWNLVLAVAGYLVWRGLCAARRVAWRHRRTALTAVRAVAVLVTVVVGLAAVYFSLLLALALLGLFVRPSLGKLVDGTVRWAMVVAMFAVGLVLVGGVEPLTGVLLGTAAYCAQALTALVLTMPRSWRHGRARLMLAQQNGMTAILLALLVEPAFPGAIGVVVPAIVTANTLHVLCNAMWDRFDPPNPDLETSGGVTPFRRSPTRSPLPEPDR